MLLVELDTEVLFLFFYINDDTAIAYWDQTMMAEDYNTGL